MRSTARIHYFDEVTSTNDVAALLAEQGAPDGTVVVAASQTAGRGRRGRSWFSLPGAGLYVSVIFRERHGAAGAANVARHLTLAAGVALAESVRSITGLPVEIKWPNDLVIGRPRRKLAGVLAEVSVSGSDLSFVILGFGVNLRRAAYPPQLATIATSIEDELGRSIDAEPLLSECLAALTARHAELRAGRAAPILERFRALAPSARGSLVSWQDERGVRQGVTEGIDENGALVVRVGAQLERVIAGDLKWS